MLVRQVNFDLDVSLAPQQDFRKKLKGMGWVKAVTKVLILDRQAPGKSRMLAAAEKLV